MRYRPPDFKTSTSSFRSADAFFVLNNLFEFLLSSSIQFLPPSIHRISTSPYSPYERPYSILLYIHATLISLVKIIRHLLQPDDARPSTLPPPQPPPASNLWFNLNVFIFFLCLPATMIMENK